MIETLILGILLGAFAACIGAAYSAHRYLKRPWMYKKLSGNYEVVAIDKNFEGDTHRYLVLRKDNKIIFATRFDDDGIKDIIYDVI